MAIKVVTPYFLSNEHVLTAQCVGLDKDGNQLKCRNSGAPFHKDTLLPFGDDGKKLPFGYIIALAGDFYAHFDQKAAHDFASVWPDLSRADGLASVWPDLSRADGVTGYDYRQPTLSDEAPNRMKEIESIVTDNLDGVPLILRLLTEWIKDLKSFLLPRFGLLASANLCHFGSQSWDGTIDDTANDALMLYRAYHQRAIAEAEAAGESEQKLLHALAVDAFGCHFLTDLFASGHIRVPRSKLFKRFGLFRGGIMAVEMHKEDNELGLWCQRRKPDDGPRVVWRAYGDSLLLGPMAELHFAAVKEMVRRSAAEIFAAFCGERRHPVDPADPVAGLPVPLRAGTGPAPGDMLPDNTQAKGDPNHYPLYALNPDPKDSRIGRRQGKPSNPTYEFSEGNSGTFTLASPSAS